MAEANPEQIARDQIDRSLEQAGWNVQSTKKIDLTAGRGSPSKNSRPISDQPIMPFSSTRKLWA
jgi:type I site-specific restriction endonuclease